MADTDGLAALWQGQPIQALFFSSAAGKTVDAVEVWGNSVPYLTSVDSPEGEEVPNYHTTVTVPVEEFRAKLLEQYPDADLSGEPSGWFTNLTNRSGGGVESVDVGGVPVTGAACATLFGLRSASFTVTADAANVTFSVTGYGHGVGMSQYGGQRPGQGGKELRGDPQVVLHRHRRGPLHPGGIGDRHKKVPAQRAGTFLCVMLEEAAQRRPPLRELRRSDWRSSDSLLSEEAMNCLRRSSRWWAPPGRACPGSRRRCARRAGRRACPVPRGGAGDPWPF